jgi:creatinine amidohydrolase
MLDRLQGSVGNRAAVLAYTDLPAVIGIWRRVVEEESGLGARVGGHADIAESSVMLALHPRLVRKRAAAAGCLEAVTPAFIERILKEGFHTVSPNGIIGDARGLDAAIGRRCIAELVEVLLEQFQG